MLRRRRFRDLVQRQLDLFAAEHADAIARVREARERYRRAPREDSHEAFGDFQDEAGWAAEELAELRDAYAATLPDESVDEYEEAFRREASRRFGDIAEHL